MMIRKVKIFSLLILYCSCVFSQDIPESDNDSLLSGNGFASVYFIPSSIGSKMVYYMGGAGSLIVNEKYMIGGYGLRKTGTMYAEKGALKGKMMSLGSAGILLGYRFFTLSSRVRPVFQCQAGWGGLTVSTTDSKGYAITDQFNRLLVVMPSLSVDYHLFWQMWLSAGAGYMWINGVDLDGYTEQDFSRFGGYISLKVITGS
jgi:hypothetical protein